MEIYIKQINLTNNCNKAIIKTKWNDDKLNIHLFVKDKTDIWSLYRAQTGYNDILKQCNPLDISIEKIKEYLTAKNIDSDILFDVQNNKKFIIYVKECMGSEDDFADIIYFKQSIVKENFPKECMDILLEQIEDLDRTTTELSHKNAILKKNQEDLEVMCSRYEKLVAAKQAFEDQFYTEAIHLLNSKKKFIQENIGNVTKLNVSSFIDKSDDSIIKNALENNFPSTSRTPLKTPTKNPSSLTRTPKSAKRTPSKRLLELQKLNDSDDSDSFSVFTCDQANKFSPKVPSSSLDSSRVFKNFKIKTPVKSKEDKRESSVELKIEKINHSSENKSDSDHEKSLEKSVDYQNAQKIDSDSSKNQTVELNISDADEIPCSQDLSISQFSSSYHKRKEIIKSNRSQNRSKKQKLDSSPEIDPYEADTINILNKI